MPYGFLDHDAGASHCLTRKPGTKASRSEDDTKPRGEPASHLNNRSPLPLECTAALMLV
ncbi:hypothetical protein D9619_011420 [Psilocybe cf. subviscida]|uniref:Uncharacterized protein n=1 Tax=Psilocybe cf. subviscida TaxID=2480587 RepID=A0A8H5BLB6_9AGAR|nr:hypothetical protein D9619_011420 [Psilocybe cf. subviscida]